MYEQKKKGGSKKYGRSKRKAQGKQSPISKYVRGVMPFDKYLRAAKK